MTAPAAECSAQNRNYASGPRLCIRAAQHHGAHIDERGFHWSDTTAVYPVDDGTFRRGTDVRAALRRMADEEQPEGSAPTETLDLTDSPARCPLCPDPVTLHTPNGARAHFAHVHPEQQLVGPGPWPLLATDGDQATAGHLITCFAVAGGNPDPDCLCAAKTQHYEVADETRPLCACGRFWPCNLYEEQQPETQATWTPGPVAVARAAEWASQQRAATVDPAMCPRCKGDNSEAFELCTRCADEEQQPETQATPVGSAAIRRKLRRWAYAAGHIESELDGAVDRMYALIAEDIAHGPDVRAALRRMADEEQQPETPRKWCKCPSCWGWFVDEHPGEDLDELGKDLGWWSGLPEHRDAPTRKEHPMHEAAKVSPHAWESKGWRFWICHHCYAPKSLHPRTGWARSRPLHDNEYFSANAPHFKEGW